MSLHSGEAPTADELDEIERVANKFIAADVKVALHAHCSVMLDSSFGAAPCHLQLRLFGGFYVKRNLCMCLAG